MRFVKHTPGQLSGSTPATSTRPRSAGSRLAFLLALFVVPILFGSLLLEDYLPLLQQLRMLVIQPARNGQYSPPHTFAKSKQPDRCPRILDRLTLDEVANLSEELYFPFSRSRACSRRSCRRAISLSYSSTVISACIQGLALRISNSRSSTTFGFAT